MFYYNAFLDLDTERITGYGNVTRIPYSKIWFWIEKNRWLVWDEEQEQHFITIIKTIDCEYVKWINNKHKEEEAKQG